MLKSLVGLFPKTDENTLENWKDLLVQEGFSELVELNGLHDADWQALRSKWPIRLVNVLYTSVKRKDSDFKSNKGNESSRPAVSTKCFVFWDVENCPIPWGQEVSYFAALRDALKKHNYHPNHIWLIGKYGEKQRERLQDTQITCIDPGKMKNGGARKETADCRIMCDMYNCALDNPGCTFVLITGDSDFGYTSKTK